MSIKLDINSVEQKKRHEEVARKLIEVGLEIHVLACEDLMQVIKLNPNGKPIGDVTLCQHLFHALGGAAKGGNSYSATRVEALKAWFFIMSGKQIMADGETWHMKKGWSVEKFATPEEMEKTPYWKLLPEKKYTFFSIEQFVKDLNGYQKKLKNSLDEGRFQGDPMEAEKLIAGVIDFAEARAARLSKQQLGAKLPTQATNAAGQVVEPADSKGGSRAAVAAAKAAEHDREMGAQVEPEPEVPVQATA